MGVEGLHKFINIYCNDSIQTMNISELRSKSIVIDGMQHVYSQLIYMRSTNKEVITENGKNISHIHGLLNSLQYYLKNEIIPIFVFDGKSPDIKKKKIEERKKKIKKNLQKLKELGEMKKNIERIIEDNKKNTESYKYDYPYNYNENNDNSELNKLIFGTPPTDEFLYKQEQKQEENFEKIEEIHEEYRKLYKKSILFKDYFIIDWIEIINFLGLPVVKADGEADPLCSYILKYNPNVFGIVSDDSDMLVFGSPILMKKTKHQNFNIIKNVDLLKSISYLLSDIYNINIEFSQEDFVNFSVLLGTDYGNIELKSKKTDSMEILKYYIENNKKIENIILEDQYEEFLVIKEYYTKSDELFYDKYDDFLMKPIWEKPKFEELKIRLLELDVDEDYINKTNKSLNNCYNEIRTSKDNKIKKRKSNNYYNKNKIINYENESIEEKFKDIFSFNKNQQNYKITTEDEYYSEEEETNTCDEQEDMFFIGDMASL